MDNKHSKDLAKALGYHVEEEVVIVATKTESIASVIAALSAPFLAKILKGASAPTSVVGIDSLRPGDKVDVYSKDGKNKILKDAIVISTTTAEELAKVQSSQGVKIINLKTHIISKAM